MTLNNKVYDVLKWVVCLVLPALGTLYFAISKIWGLPFGEEIVGSVSAVCTFLGTSLKISDVNYNKSEDETAE